MQCIYHYFQILSFIIIKLKFHFILHLPDIILETGPPILILCMRYESKHRELKTIAAAVASRINICKTIATKLQLKLCYRFLSDDGFSNTITYGKYKNDDSLRFP